MRLLIILALLLLALPVRAESLFAEIDANGTVIRVIVAEQDFINTGRVGNPKNWIRTFRNGGPRKHYAGPGFTYDRAKDRFIPPKPFPSWVLDDARAIWVAPVKQPDGDYQWDEKQRKWIEGTR